MNTARKATFAASALAITIVGAVLVTAPMLFAKPMSVVANRACSTSSPQLILAGHGHCDDINRNSLLLVFNRS